MHVLVAGLAALAVQAPLPGVVSPSGNIRCFYVPAGPAHLLCDVRRAAYLAREQNRCMARAGLDWHGWEIYATRRTTTVCSGGILYNSNRNRPDYKRLAYGRSWRFGGVPFLVGVSGLDCTPPIPA